MIESLYRPTPHNKGHRELLQILSKECEKRELDMIEPPHYSSLPVTMVDKYKENFSLEVLHIRSFPDVIILGKYHSLFVDAKDSYRPDTGNICIELSCFFNHIMRRQMGYLSLYVCFYKEDNEKIPYFIRFPYGPDMVHIPEYWDGKGEKNTFLHMISTIKDVVSELGNFEQKREIIIKEHTKPNIKGAIGDPFTLTRWGNLDYNSIGDILDKFVKINASEVFSGK